MGMIARHTSSGIKKRMKEISDLMEKAIINRLTFIGEQFVINARTNANFTDQTGNLRSSIGFIVLKNGKKVGGSSFDTVKTGSKGAQQGKSLINQLKGQFSSGYALIVVAGMDYAAAVEAKGKDVLTGSSKIAERELAKAIKSLEKSFAQL